MNRQAVYDRWRELYNALRMLCSFFDEPTRPKPEVVIKLHASNLWNVYEKASKLAREIEGDAAWRETRTASMRLAAVAIQHMARTQTDKVLRDDLYRLAERMSAKAEIRARTIDCATRGSTVVAPSSAGVLARKMP